MLLLFLRNIALRWHEWRTRPEYDYIERVMTEYRRLER